jgi:hypothetical protein
MTDFILNILTWFLIMLGVCSIGIVVWFVVWTMTEEIEND